MLDFVLSAPARIFALLAADVVPLAAAVAVLAAAGLLTFMVNQLHADRPVRPEPRHRPHALTVTPISAPPVPAVEPDVPFDPLDERTSLEQVERFLASLTEDTGELVIVQ